MPPRRAARGHVDQDGTPDWAVGLEPEIVSRAQRFRGIGVRNTIWADRSTMHDMGILDAADRVLDQMGLHGLARLSYPTYESPTVQFFTTLEMMDNDDCEEGARGCSFTFYIDRTRYEMTIPQLGACFGFPNDKDKEPQYISDARQLWRWMTNEDYRGDEARSMKVRNPVLRYVVRLLANTLFARQDSGKVKVNELCLLHRGLEGALNESLQRDTEANNAYMFLENILEFRKIASSTSLLCFGGMLTRLFDCLNIDLTGHARLEGTSTMDVAYLIAARSLEIKNNGTYLHRWIMHGAEYRCHLPQPEYVIPSSPRHIRFEVPTSILYTPPQASTRRRGPRRAAQRSDSPMQESSDDEVPQEFMYQPEAQPQRPPPPTTEEGMMWATYHDRRHDIYDREMSQMRRITSWLAEKHAKAMAKLRKIRDEMTCQRAPDVHEPTWTTYEHGSASAAAGGESPHEAGGNGSPDRRRRRVD